MHVGIANLQWREKRSRIPGACATHNFTYLARSPWHPCLTSPISQSNSLALDRSGFNFQCGILNCIVVITSMDICSSIAFWWMEQGSTDDKSALIKIMAQCRQATSHCLSQCQPMPYGITMPWWFYLVLEILMGENWNMFCHFSKLRLYRHPSTWKTNDPPKLHIQYC